MKEKELLIRLNRHIRKKSIYKESELVDYKISMFGEIIIYFLSGDKKKKMKLSMSDIDVDLIGFNVVRKFEENRMYVPFKYLIDNGVKICTTS